MRTRMNGLTVCCVWQDKGAEVVHPEGWKPLLTVLLCVVLQVLLPVHHVAGAVALVVGAGGVKQRAPVMGQLRFSAFPAP